MLLLGGQQGRLLGGFLLRQGGVAFTDLAGTFYPAVSLNRNCRVRLRTSLEPPTSDLSSGSDSDGS